MKHRKKLKKTLVEWLQGHDPNFHGAALAEELDAYAQGEKTLVTYNGWLDLDDLIARLGVGGHLK